MVIFLQNNIIEGGKILFLFKLSKYLFLEYDGQKLNIKVEMILISMFL
jgi:hypothetical protein